jgi:TetR/AcrR family transcriptional regulator, transcriptional repressor for nem operon
LAAAAHWQTYTAAFFATAAYHAPSDPLDRIIAYVEFRKSMLTGDLPEYTCFAGTIIQEAYRTHPEVSAACETSISRHADTLEADIRAAMRKYGVRGQWTARSLALHIQAVIQGGFILAKAEGTAGMAEQNLEHLRRYIELLFGRSNKRPARRKGGAS